MCAAILPGGAQYESRPDQNGGSPQIEKGVSALFESLGDLGTKYQFRVLNSAYFCAHSTTFLASTKKAT